MGNQGTKDWKLTAFFAISLMLIAGLFGNAAIAADGDGTITVGWARSGGAAPDDSYAASPVTPPLPAGSTGNILKFTYIANGVNMNGGSVRITIRNGWKVPAAGVQVLEDAAADKRLFLVGTPLSSDSPTVDNDQGDTAGNVQLAVGETIHSGLKDQRRVTFTRDGDDITAIEVKLDSENWDTDGTELRITFINTTVPIPDRLVYPDNDTGIQPYAEYTFITESKTKRGSFTQLNPTSEMLDPQPRVTVGNIENSVAGTVKITPEIAYEGQENVNFTIVFKALGPLYDWTGTDTDIVVGVQSEVTLPDMTDGNVSFSTKGSVRFEATPIEPISFSNGGITINISQINKGNEVSISYGPVEIGASTSATEDNPEQSAFTVSLRSDITVPLSSDIITGGRTQALEGSGTMKFTNPRNARVEVGAEVRSLAITYTAAIALPDAPDPVTLVITVAGIDTSTTALQEGTQGSANPGDITGTGSSANRTLAVSGSDTITWKWTISPFTRAGATFTTTIRNVDIQDTSAEVTWTTSIGGVDLTNPPVLYITNPVDNAVDFISDADSSYSAAEEVNSIRFTFTARSTIINDGKVEFRGIPSSWSPLPNSKGPAGKTTVTINGVETTEGIRYGSTVSVDVPDLDYSPTNETVTITYENFTMQSQATPADKPIKITGYFTAITERKSP